jgi:hypothetical protein
VTGRSPEDGDDDPQRRNFVNMVVVVAVLVLLVLGYWAFNALQRSWRLQRCLDSGRRNCADYVNPRASRP